MGGLVLFDALMAYRYMYMYVGSVRVYRALKSHIIPDETCSLDRRLT